MNTVLVVEDEPEILAMLCLMLSSEGFYAHRAANGQEAIDKFRQSSVDVVIANMCMAEMDGIEVVRKLKKLDDSVAVIVLAAYADLNSAVCAFESDGICNYLTKPLENPEVLIAAVKGALKTRRLQLQNKELLSKLKHIHKYSKKKFDVCSRHWGFSIERPTPLGNYHAHPEKIYNHGPSDGSTGSYPLFLKNGKNGSASPGFQNISDLRQSRQNNCLSKNMLQAVFNGISDPLILLDCDLKVRMFNRAAKYYYQIKVCKDWIGKKCNELPNTSKICKQCKIPQAVVSGQAMVFERYGYMQKNKYEKVTIYPLSSSVVGIDGALIQITDITKTKTLEHRMIQNEKLSSLGRLGAGVAHEINNPNNFIMFNIPILKSYLKAMLSQLSENIDSRKSNDWFGMSFDEFANEIFHLVGNLEHGTRRIDDIVTNLRTLVKAEAGGQSRSLCNINKIIHRVGAFCRKEIKNYVKTFKVQCPDDFPLVISDSVALEQILINLLVNAAHAANKPDSRIELSVKLLKGNILNITVEDNGAGMDDKTLKRIFDPFFTTKAPGSGAGLGLSVCYTLIHTMQGTLEVKSVLNSGSVFMVALPVELGHHVNLSEDLSTGFFTG